MHSQTHHQLIRLCLDGPICEDAWLEFERRFRPRLVAGIRRGTAYSYRAIDRDRIDELLQDCYCRILDRDRKVLRDCLDLEEAQTGAYLVQLGRSVALDWLRHRGAAKRGEDETVEVDQEWLSELHVQEATAERQLCAQETLDAFWRECRSIALAIGNPRSLQFLRQAWFQQTPSREIAATAGVATSTVDSVVCRMRRRLEARGWDVAKRL